MIKRWLGIDGFDLLIQVGITAMIMVIVESASRGPDADGALAAVVAVSLGVLAWRRSRALKNRPPQTSGEYQAERLAMLEDRVAELEQGQSRVLELEERLEFTERMLVQVREQADAARLLPGEPGRA
jgi:membrane protein implicated in regulation of membrane protease activity